jgi:hypothetical protein
MIFPPLEPQVMSLCGSIPEENVYRAHFSALTVPEIKRLDERRGRGWAHGGLKVGKASCLVHGKETW